MDRVFELDIRVRYQETDGQGRVHHANYLTYFEQARVEMLRAAGHSYKALEADGLMLVVAEANLEYRLPAEYDDVLRIRVETLRARGARITHRYEVFRGGEVLMTAQTTLACVRRDGRPSRIPNWMATPRGE